MVSVVRDEVEAALFGLVFGASSASTSSPSFFGARRARRVVSVVRDSSCVSVFFEDARLDFFGSSTGFSTNDSSATGASSSGSRFSTVCLIGVCDFFCMSAKAPCNFFAVSGFGESAIFLSSLLYPTAFCRALNIPTAAFVLAASTLDPDALAADVALSTTTAKSDFSLDGVLVGVGEFALGLNPGVKTYFRARSANREVVGCGPGVVPASSLPLEGPKGDLAGALASALATAFSRLTHADSLALSLDKLSFSSLSRSDNSASFALIADSFFSSAVSRVLNEPLSRSSDLNAADADSASLKRFRNFSISPSLASTVALTLSICLCWFNI